MSVKFLNADELVEQIIKCSRQMLEVRVESVPDGKDGKHFIIDSCRAQISQNGRTEFQRVIVIVPRH